MAGVIYIAIIGIVALLTVAALEQSRRRRLLRARPVIDVPRSLAQLLESERELTAATRRAGQFERAVAAHARASHCEELAKRTSTAMPRELAVNRGEGPRDAERRSA